MRFITILFFCCLIGLAVGFGALAVWDMPQPKEHVEKTVDNGRFFGNNGEK